jgi:hypothetical protein
MGKNINLAIGLGLLLAAVLACGATTANISSLKISSDENGKNETKTFKPGDKVYTVAQISNNGGKVDVKWRLLYDEGDKAGQPVPQAEKSLEIDGDRPAVFWVTLPPAGLENGRYKSEVSMVYSGEQKDQKTGTFELRGY